MITQELEILLYKYSFFDIELNVSIREKLFACFQAKNQNGEMIWHSDYHRIDSILEKYPNVLDILKSSKSLALRYFRKDDVYEGEIYHIKREGGYKEPFIRENIIMTQNISLNKLFSTLNDTLSHNNLEIESFKRERKL